MKSVRLKRRNHTKRRKLTKGRKLRKGGNGSSSSSSKVSFNSLKRLIIELKEWRGLLIEEEMDPGTNDPEELKGDIDRNIDKILSVFKNNRIDLSQLTQQETDLLLHLIIGITDNFDDNAEIDNQIVEAYAQAYLRYKDTNNSSILDIEHLNSEIEDINSLIEAIESGEDDVYENDDDKEEAVQHYMNQIENIKKILNIFIAEKTHMVKSISLFPKEKDHGPNALSTERGLLPDAHVAHIMSYLIPNYKHVATEPMQHSRVISNTLENIKTMPSRKKTQIDVPYSEVDGGRKRTMRKRKSIRRRK
jgi:hypothetical protein